MTARLQASLGRVAIGVSTLCAFHCLLIPATVVLFPTLGAVLGSDEMFHEALVFFVVPSSIGALGLGCRRHRDRAVLALGVIGIVTLLVTLAFGHTEYWERVGTIAGSGLVLVAHARNYRLCRGDDCSHQ
jgi:MerC mercury resistance protein